MRVLTLIFAALSAASTVGCASILPSKQQQLLKDTRRLHRRLPPPPVKNLGATAYSTLYLPQELDHFDPTVNVTWQQRYFANPELYEEGGPVFIFIEGESAADGGWIERGNSYMYTMAELFKARMYVLEHRYFGASRPTKDITTENLKWLSSDQALADLATFIEYLIAKGEMKQGQKVAVFGGSYPGNLAAWARIKYPHLIHAAVSSSAPVHAEEDFPEYFEVVTRSIRTVVGDLCADNLVKAFNRIKRLLMTTDGLESIQRQFYMCNPLDVNNKLDMDFFYNILSSSFATATQYNRDTYQSTYSLSAQCRPMMKDMTDDEAVRGLATVFSNSQGWILGCIDWSYESNTQYLKETAFTSSSDRQWVYMTCTMFGYFQTFNGNTSFPKGYVDVPYYLQQCIDAFGDDYQDAMVQKGVKRTNMVFGDWTPDVTNVMFVNGDVDPWHALGVLKNVNPSSPAILIPGQSHCYDMYPNTSSDPPELLAAREKIKEFLRNALYTSINSG